MSDSPRAIVSVKPVTLSAPDRGEDLQVRVSAPVTGDDLPVLVFSHGYGWSMNGYAPWRTTGPHRASWSSSPRTSTQEPSPSRTRTPVSHGCGASVCRTSSAYWMNSTSWRRPYRASRAASTTTASPWLSHSWGAQTASTLLGARVLDPDGVPGEDLSDPRVKAGVLLALTGLGDSLTPFAAEQLPFMRPSFTTMTTPALIVAGDHDDSPLSTRGPDWFTDPYTYSPGDKTLLTLFDAEHSLGGIPGYEVAETTDENPARVALLQQLTTAFLRSALHPEDTGWQTAATALDQDPDSLGKLESK